MNKLAFSKELELTSMLEEDVIDATNEEIAQAIKDGKINELKLKPNTERSVFKMKRLGFQEMLNFEAESKTSSVDSEEDKLKAQTQALYNLFNKKFISVKLKRDGLVILLKPEDLDPDSMAFDCLTEAFGMPMLLNIASQCYLNSSVGQKKTITNLLAG